MHLEVHLETCSIHHLCKSLLKVISHTLYLPHNTTSLTKNSYLHLIMNRLLCATVNFISGCLCDLWQCIDKLEICWSPFWNRESKINCIVFTMYYNSLVTQPLVYCCCFSKQQIKTIKTILYYK